MILEFEQSSLLWYRGHEGAHVYPCVRCLPMQHLQTLRWTRRAWLRLEENERQVKGEDGGFVELQDGCTMNSSLSFLHDKEMPEEWDSAFHSLNDVSRKVASLQAGRAETRRASGHSPFLRRRGNRRLEFRKKTIYL